MILVDIYGGIKNESCKDCQIKMVTMITIVNTHEQWSLTVEEIEIKEKLTVLDYEIKPIYFLGRYE